METNLAISIAKYRAQKNMTPGNLAEKLGVPEETISRWESGRERPGLSQLPALANALGVNADKLLGNSGAKAASPRNYDLYGNHPWATPANITFLIASILGFAGIVTCLVVNLAMNQQITWGVFPIVSILYAWISALPVVLVKKQRAGASMLVASLLLLPFLYILSHYTGGWFFSLGIPCAVGGVVFAWVLRFVWMGGLSVWNKLAITALATAAIDAGVDFALYRAGMAGRFPSTGEYISLLGLLAGAVVLVVIGLLRGKRS